MTHPPANFASIDMPDGKTPGIVRKWFDGRGWIESRRLFRGSRELVIDHGGRAYHLRITRNDKLILTK